MLKKFRGYDTNVASVEAFQDVKQGEQMTVQSEKDNCDINVIVKRFGVTGQLPIVSRLPTYGDFDSIFDFRSAMESVRSAQERFDALPSDVRKRFYNDPQMFVEFASDPKNLDEMRKMGLAKALPPEVVESPPKAE